MKIYTKPAGPMGANTYLLTEDDKTAVAIDCGGEEVWDYALSKGLKIEYVLLTHGHFDHIAGCPALAAKGVKIGAAKSELPLLQSKANLAFEFGAASPEFPVSFTFEDGDALSLCGMEISVIATPGHTAGGVCFLTGENLFTGDTLFFESVGRTDFPTGNAAQLVRSIKEKLFTLSGDRRVFPGHEEETTLAHEKQYNPFIR